MNTLNAFKKANGNTCRNVQYIELAVNKLEKCIEEQKESCLLDVNKNKINLDNIETKNEHKLVYLNNIILINSTFKEFLKLFKTILLLVICSLIVLTLLPSVNPVT